MFFLDVTNKQDEERSKRLSLKDKMLHFGISFLDEALNGIANNDLILLGAPSGVGKTSLCCQIAFANVAAGKRVNYIALEAAQFEIQRRIKFPMICEKYYADKNRPQLGTLRFVSWCNGIYGNRLDKYENEISEYFTRAYKNLYLYRGSNKFGLDELIDAIVVGSQDADLIIVDHVHYFDLDERENENVAIKKIIKECRRLVLHENKPIILVAHLRKKTFGNNELAPGMEEFHGSSDLYKIASQVITFGPGRPLDGGSYETFFRIPKSRYDGTVSRFLARMAYSPKKGAYEANYRLGWHDQTEFEAIDDASIPNWADHALRNNTFKLGDSRVPFETKPRADLDN